MKKKLLILTGTAERINLINIIGENFKDNAYIECIAIVLNKKDSESLNNKIFKSILIFDNFNKNIYNHEGENIDNKLLNDIINRDRYLDNNNNSIILCKIFWSVLMKKISEYEFVLGIGEVSWAYEEITFRALQLMNFEYITPSSSRFIENSWFLAPAMSENVPIKLRTISNIKNIKILDKRPDYFVKGIPLLSIQMRILKIDFQRVINHLRTRKRLKLVISKITHFISLYFPNHSRENLIKLRTKYKGIILYSMHVQPEASIDYLSYANRDQYEIIRNLRNKLPITYALCVKPHPGSIHEMNIWGRIKIHCTKHVYFINKSIDAIKDEFLFDHCVTVTGTMAGQFAMVGKESYTLEPIFFNNHLLCKFSSISDIPKLIEKAKHLSTTDLLHENSRFISYLSSYSLKGYTGLQYDNSFDAEYINSLCCEITEIFSFSIN